MKEKSKKNVASHANKNSDIKNMKCDHTLDSVNSIHTVNNRVTIKTDTGTITRSNLPASGVPLDNSDFFEIRSNPLSSKGSTGDYDE